MAESLAKIISLQAEISLFARNNKELKHLNSDLRDEHQALQMAFSSLEDKLRRMQVNLGIKQVEWSYLWCFNGNSVLRMFKCIDVFNVNLYTTTNTAIS